MFRNTLRKSTRHPIKITPFVCSLCRVGLRQGSSAPSSVAALVRESLRKDAAKRKIILEKKRKKQETDYKNAVEVEQRAAEQHTTEEDPASEVSISGTLFAAAMKRSEPLYTPDNVIKKITDEVEVQSLSIEGQRSVKTLAHGLERVLFNPGVFYLQDPRTCVYNFDPYLQQIMPVTEFNYNAVASYVTSSKDVKLELLAKELGKRYMGSTSSMTTIMSHIHFLISAWRSVGHSVLSKSFPLDYPTFTSFSKAPASIFLRYKQGAYAIDADRELDVDNILNLMGRSLEKLLTSTPEEYEGYRKCGSHESPESRSGAGETYHYSTLGDILMRSQLDAHDPRLPGRGVFDLKTRAVLAVRMDVMNFHLGSGYQIKSLRGEYESFEREYFDLIRSAFLKYSLQARMGNMDGIFVAYHNTETIFGFQYISLEEMEQAIHGSTQVGEKEFVLNLQLLNQLLDGATKRFPKTSLRITFEAREAQTPFMFVFAEPVAEGRIDEIQHEKHSDFEGLMRTLREKRESVMHLGVKPPQVTAYKGMDKPVSKAEQFDVENANPSKNASIFVGDNSEMHEELLLMAGENQAEDIQALKDVQDLQDEDEETVSKNLTVSGEVQDGEASQKNDRESGEGAAIGNIDIRVSGSEQYEKSVSLPRDNTLRPVGGDLLAMKVYAKNFVDGEAVVRPEKIYRENRWDIEYRVLEIADSTKARNLYAAMLKRKSKGHITHDSMQVNSYIKMLRNLSNEGREWAREKAIFEEEKIVVGR